MSTDHNFLRERRAEADSNRSPSAYQPKALALGQTGSHTDDAMPFAFMILPRGNSLFCRKHEAQGYDKIMNSPEDGQKLPIANWLKEFSPSSCKFET